jgi:hypothetical protein
MFFSQKTSNPSVDKIKIYFEPEDKKVDSVHIDINIDKKMTIQILDNNYGDKFYEISQSILSKKKLEKIERKEYCYFLENINMKYMMIILKDNYCISNLNENKRCYYLPKNYFIQKKNNHFHNEIFSDSEEEEDLTFNTEDLINYKKTNGKNEIYLENKVIHRYNPQEKKFFKNNGTLTEKFFKIQYQKEIISIDTSKIDEFGPINEKSKEITNEIEDKTNLMQLITTNNEIFIFLCRKDKNYNLWIEMFDKVFNKINMIKKNYNFDNIISLKTFECQQTLKDLFNYLLFDIHNLISNNESRKIFFEGFSDKINKICDKNYIEILEKIFIFLDLYEQNKFFEAWNIIKVIKSYAIKYNNNKNDNNNELILLPKEEINKFETIGKEIDDYCQNVFQNNSQSMENIMLNINNKIKGLIDNDFFKNSYLFIIEKILIPIYNEINDFIDNYKNIYYYNNNSKIDEKEIVLLIEKITLIMSLFYNKINNFTLNNFLNLNYNISSQGSLDYYIKNNLNQINF